MKIILNSFLLFLFFFSCTKKEDRNFTDSKSKHDFTWHDGLTAAEIPDFPVKGLLNGKEINFNYINFEKWRGSNDNVINFSVNKPGQPCGFIEEFEGFVLMNKSAPFNIGGWIKPKFDEDPGSYTAYYKSGGKKSETGWNCALSIGELTEKTVKGKIVMYFNDAQKSYIAGSFEAVVCNN